MEIDINKPDFFEEMEKRIPKGKVRTRFAPSPTGYMHIGNLRTALYTWLIAKKNDGTFIFRLEDTDKKREVEGACDVIYRTLKECGLTHDEGPDVGGPVGPYIQSERRNLYKKYAELLVERGHAYYCFCDKDEEAEADSAGAADADADAAARFVKTEDPCRSLELAEARRRVLAGEPYVIRQKVPAEGTTTFKDVSFGEITVPNDSLDDQVLLKRDGLPTYNFANVVDDHLMGITHVVRGSEYLASAPKYNLLYEGFGWDIPEYVHCSPVMRDAHNKMSKRHGDPSYEDLRAQGFLTEAIINYVALLGWSPKGKLSEKEFFTLEELKDAFELDGISKSPAIFDIEKLKYFNAEYIRAMTPEAFLSAARPFIRTAVKTESIDPAKIAPLLHQRCEVLTDIPGKLDFFDELPEYGIDLYTNKKSKTNPEISLAVLKKLLPMLEALGEWDVESIKGVFTLLAEQEGKKNATVMWPARIAVSGRAVTPGGVIEICDILGKDESIRRIRAGIAKLEAALGTA